MKNYHRLLALLVGLLMIPALANSKGGDLTAYAEMSTHYEAIRLSLLADTT